MNKRILLEIYVPSLERLVEIRCSEYATVEHVGKALQRYLFGNNPVGTSDMLLCTREDGKPLNPASNMYTAGLHNGGGLVFI